MASFAGTGAGGMVVTGDFRDIGALTVQVDVLQNKSLVGTFVRPFGSLGVLSRLGPSGPAPRLISGAMLPPAETIEPTLSFVFDGQFRFTEDGTGDTLVGTSLRISALSPLTPFQTVRQLDLGLSSPMAPPFSVVILDAQRLGGTLTCPCDWNSSASLNSQDFFDFLVDFFVGDADYNHDGFTNSQDFFDFLSCFFTIPEGC